MLAVRIVGDEEMGDGFPEFCSLCGKPSDDYLITPWDHINVCKGCMEDFLNFGRVAYELSRRSPPVLNMASDYERGESIPHGSSP